MPEPFYFFTEQHLIQLLGMKARTPEELLQFIAQVPASSIYYHTHRFLQQHHYLSPEPPNDFAYWVTAILGLEALGERLASIDIIHFLHLKDLRSAFTRVLDDYLSRGGFSAACEPGEEFHFMSCRTFVMPTPYAARTLAEFVDIMQKISPYSLYFHMFEARLRLKKAENDFSRWFKDMGLDRLAGEMARLDPYTITLEGLREKIIRAAKKYV